MAPNRDICGGRGVDYPDDHPPTYWSTSMKRLLFAAFAAVLLLPASALARDRNHDNLPDRWEHAHHLSLKHDQARRDQDRDGVRNRGEFKHGLNPRKDDSDG